MLIISESNAIINELVEFLSDIALFILFILA